MFLSSAFPLQNPARPHREERHHHSSAQQREKGPHFRSVGLSETKGSNRFILFQVKVRGFRETQLLGYLRYGSAPVPVLTLSGGYLPAQDSIELSFHQKKQLKTQSTPFTGNPTLPEHRAVLKWKPRICSEIQLFQFAHSLG